MFDCHKVGWTEPIQTKHTAVDGSWCGVPDDYLII